MLQLFIKPQFIVFIFVFFP